MSDKSGEVKHKIIIMKGKKAELDLFDMEFGNSDLSIKGQLSDLPAIIHHTSTPVNAHLDITSKTIDFAEITNYSKKDSIGIDEKIEDLKIGLTFNSSARAFTESPNLPVGEFFIDLVTFTVSYGPLVPIIESNNSSGKSSS